MNQAAPIYVERWFEPGTIEVEHASWFPTTWKSDPITVRAVAGALDAAAAERIGENILVWGIRHSAERSNEILAERHQLFVVRKVRPAALYRCFDSEGSLLYVGVSSVRTSRIWQHRESEWFGLVATITIAHFPTRREALIAEHEAIAIEQPRFNRTTHYSESVA